MLELEISLEDESSLWNVYFYRGAGWGGGGGDGNGVSCRGKGRGEGGRGRFWPLCVDKVEKTEEGKWETLYHWIKLSSSGVKSNIL